MKFIKNEKGFSYIDVMIGIVILLVGILAMVSAITANLMRTYENEKRVVAKQIALSTIESITSARDIARPEVVEGWNSIGNVGMNPINGVPKGIFLTGWCPIREESGWDGVAGTIDDACPAGSGCNVTNRPENNSQVINEYERQIIIEDIPDSERPSPPYAISRRKIIVKIKYFMNQIEREVELSTILTNY